MAEQLPHQGETVSIERLFSVPSPSPNDAVELVNLDEAILNQMDQIQKEVRRPRPFHHRSSIYGFTTAISSVGAT